MFLGSVTAFGFIPSKGFSPAQILSVLTLALLFAGTLTMSGRRREAGVIQTLCLSASLCPSFSPLFRSPKEKTALRQVAGYRELAWLFEFYQEFEIVPFDEVAARRFDDRRRRKLRIGTRDLKIAATAPVHHALLLSANRTDFERVPGLRVENWLD